MDIKEKEKLVKNLLDIKTLQPSFFMKINGQYDEWFDIINENEYLNIDIKEVDSLYLIRYLISIGDKLKETNKMNFFEQFLEKILKTDFNDNMFEEIVSIYIKFNNICGNKLLDNILESSEGNINRAYTISNKILNYITTTPNLKTDLIKVLDFVCNFIVENPNTNSMLGYEFFENESLINNMKQYYFKDFMNIVLDKFEKIFIAKEYTTIINNNNVKVNYINKSELKVTIGDNQEKIEYKNRWELEEKLLESVKRILKLSTIDKNDINMVLEGVFTDYNCSYTIEDMTSYTFGLNGDFIQYILRIINEIDEIDEDGKRKFILDKLFNSNCSVYKKLSLDLIVKNYNGVIKEFLKEKIKDNNKDIEYIIRNDVFSAEIKSIFKLINESEFEDLAIYLIPIVEMGPYIKYNMFDSNYLNKWKQKRYKELSAFKEALEKYNELKKITKIEVELLSSSRITSGVIKELSNLTENNVLEMSPNKLVNYMNTFNPSNFNSAGDFEQYSYRGEAELISNTIVKRPIIFLNNLDLFLDVRNHVFIYYIFHKIEDVITKDGINIEEYYNLVIVFCKEYLTKFINNDVKKEYLGEINEATMIKITFSLVSSIFRKTEIIDELNVDLVHEFIIKSDELIKDNSNCVDHSDSVTYLINSVQGVYSILLLDYMLLLKGSDISYTEKLSNLKKLFEKRVKKYYKDTLILIGWRFYYFRNIDSLWIEKIVEEHEEKDDIYYFICGFADCRVIENKYYQKFYDLIIKTIFTNELESATYKKLLEYLCIGDVMGYNLKEGCDFIETVMSKGKNSDIEYIINILSNINRYKFIDKDTVLDRILLLWERIVDVCYEEEKSIVSKSLTIVKNYTMKNDDVLKLVRFIMKHGELESVNFNMYSIYKALYNYIDLLIEKEFDLSVLKEVLIECKPISCDQDYINIMENIKRKDRLLFNEIKKAWLNKNLDFSVIQQYYINQN